MRQATGQRRLLEAMVALGWMRVQLPGESLLLGELRSCRRRGSTEPRSQQIRFAGEENSQGFPTFSETNAPAAQLAFSGSHRLSLAVAMYLIVIG